MKRRGFITIFLTIGSIHMALGQMDHDNEDYYLFPIKPGVRNTLAGTMGELRRTHFHTGIDIRTGGVQGVPVLAAASGFISRIAVSPGGYGNTLYITHPNGQMTVYAHLKEFAEPMRGYVIGQQYKKESFQVNLFPPKSMFNILKGDTIALSGNSGSSGGPHLHFDIRNSNQAVLNPLEYDFEEIVDTKAPEVRLVALKTMDSNARINNQFGRFEFPIRRVGNNYVVDSAIHVFGKIGVELYAYDRQDWTRFRTGITEIRLQLDGKEAFKQEIREIPFAKGRNFYNHVNFEQIQARGFRYHKLYVDDGNELDFYSTNSSRGILDFKIACEQVLTIDMFDTYRNGSTLTMSMICASPTNPVNAAEVPEMDESTYAIMDNTLIVYSKMDAGEESAVFYSGVSSYLTDPAYQIGETNVFLWDLRFGLPDSVQLCNTKEYFTVNATIPSDRSYQFYSDHIQANFSKRSLFDTIYFESKYNASFDDNRELFVFGTTSYPIRSNIEVTLFPGKMYNKEITSVYAVDDSGNFRYVGGDWEEDMVHFKTRNFGNYTLVEDSIPPTVRPLVLNSERLVYRINDKLSGIKSIEVLVNNKWVLMNYDPKISQIWSEKLESDKPFEGQVVIKLTDNAGNEKVYESNINP